MLPGISVIVCCYNSSQRLPKTLEYLSKQKVNEGISWEVIIVNNASKDDTSTVATREWDNYQKSIPLIVVDQPMPGLSYAREKGVETASYDYLLFCDDDNWLSELYVQLVYEIMTTHADIAALGGLGTPYFETEPEKWLKEMAGIYATGPQGDKSGETATHHVYGASCTYRKSAILQLKARGFTYVLTGRKGDQLLAGEDHELCYALFLSGYKIWYDDRLTFFHFIPSSRLTYQYVSKMLKGFAVSLFYLIPYTFLIHKYTGLKKKWLYAVMIRFYLMIRRYGMLRFFYMIMFRNKKDKERMIFIYNMEGLIFLMKNRTLYYSNLLAIESGFVKNITIHK